jgi:ATP-dependent Lhr-like helicase
MAFFGFHPLIEQWFLSRFRGPTEPQEQGWPHIAAGEHTLIAAPTGSGKTLTAFLACIDRLLKRALAGELRDEVSVVYVSPLRALSNDMHRNLEEPLAEILELALEAKRNASGDRNQGPLVDADLFADVAIDAPTDVQRSLEGSRSSKKAPTPLIRVGLRTGDTTPAERARIIRKPPHILVTTPESLYLMLTAQRGREALANVETIIIDEIHALVRDKRGSHLSLTIERLESLVGRPLQRVGLSATQKPIERVASYLVGGAPPDDAATHREPASDVSASDEPPDATAFLTMAEMGSPTAISIAITDSPALEPSTLHLQPSTSVLPPSTIPHRPSTSPRPPCRIVNVGHSRPLDLAIEIPPSPLGAVCMHEQWAEIHARLIELIQQHRSTLIFVNTRKLAERLTHELTELLGEDAVGSHHGSLSAEIRLKVERRLKAGEIKAVVATASLELGIDVGYIDLVVQIGSPRAIAAFLQRIGRSGHSLGLIPKGRLFALTRDELMECMGLMRAIKHGRLDAVAIPPAPLDVLAQQIVAEVAAKEWDADQLYEMFRRADPYRNLDRHEYDETLRFLAEGVPTSARTIPAYLHFDHVNRKLRARPGARMSAIANAGVIPEVGSYRVVTEGEGTVVGTLDEEFAVESNRGDVFLLGNNSWRILHVRGSDVTVADAHGAPPTIPFWQGEAPGRTVELSEEVSLLREEFEQRLDDRPALEAWLLDETKITPDAANQIISYVAAQKGALGVLPTGKTVIFERFFDETGGMQIVIHAPFGTSVTRGWGFAMRKRFCRSFDFELQATADDDGFLLSVGPQHSFPLESLFPMVTKANARSLLEQAALRTPVFQIRFRWAATRALLVLRRKNGQKVPPALQRFRADDVLSAIFPQLTGCQEHNHGEMTVPDHPLARQAMEDSLHEFMNLNGLKAVLERVEAGEIKLLARDTREPSPFCYELLNADPYAFLDGGEVQERRARAVQTRRSLTVESVNDLSRLDPEAIAQVRREAQPLVRSADELHDVLMSRIVLPVEGWGERRIEGRSDGETESRRSKGDAAKVAESLRDSKPSDSLNDILQSDPAWVEWYDALERTKRAATIQLPHGRAAWVAAERLPAALAAFPGAQPTPAIKAPPTVRQQWEDVEARVSMIRGLIEVCGPITADRIAAELSLTPSQAESALEALEGEGAVLRGRFEGLPAVPMTSESQRQREPASDDRPPSEPLAPALPSPIDHQQSPSPPPIEWCHRRLLARIHRLTMEGLRKQIEPVTPEIFIRFLLQQHGLTGDNPRTGPNGLFEVVSMLQGIDIPAASWESDLLAPRLADYRPAWLDELCLSGEIGWGRLHPPNAAGRCRAGANLTRVVPVSLFARNDLEWLLARSEDAAPEELGGYATEVHQLLTSHGALFAGDLLSSSRMLPSHLREGLGELVARGLVTADGFSGLRDLLGDRLDGDRGASRHRDMGAARKRITPRGAGRWANWRRPAHVEESNDDARRTFVEEWGWQLLRRWGVVFRDLLEREDGAPSWFELLQVFRKWEARGELRGGRFISGVAGEQFALTDTIRVLRELRDQKPPRHLVVLSAADPLNLVGVLTNHPRVPRVAGNRVAYIDGVPVAALQGGESLQLRPLAGDWPHIVQRALVGSVGHVKTAAAEAASVAAAGNRAGFPASESNEEKRRRAVEKPRRRKTPSYPNDIPRPKPW